MPAVARPTRSRGHRRDTPVGGGHQRSCHGDRQSHRRLHLPPVLRIEVTALLPPGHGRLPGKTHQIPRRGLVHVDSLAHRHGHVVTLAQPSDTRVSDIKNASERRKRLRRGSRTRMTRPKKYDGTRSQTTVGMRSRRIAGYDREVRGRSHARVLGREGLWREETHGLGRAWQGPPCCMLRWWD